MKKAKIEGVKDGYVHVRVRDIFDEPYDSENEENAGAEGVTQKETEEPKGKEEQIAVREGEGAVGEGVKTETQGAIKTEEEEEDDGDMVVITEEEQVAGENAAAREESDDEDEGGSLWTGLFSLLKYIGHFVG